MTEKTWHVNVFSVRAKRGFLSSLRSRRPKIVGYGWSASSPDGGYEFHPGTSATANAALLDATKVISELGGTVGSHNVDDEGIEAPDSAARG